MLRLRCYERQLSARRLINKEGPLEKCPNYVDLPAKKLSLKPCLDCAQGVEIYKEVENEMKKESNSPPKGAKPLPPPPSVPKKRGRKPGSKNKVRAIEQPDPAPADAGSSSVGAPGSAPKIIKPLSNDLPHDEQGLFVSNTSADSSHISSVKLASLVEKDITDYENLSIKKMVKHAGELVDEHWRYIENLLITHGAQERDIKLVKYHYRTAFIHGFKHAMEEKNNVND